MPYKNPEDEKRHKKEYWQRIKNDPEKYRMYKERRRRYYHERIKSNPESIRKKRERQKRWKKRHPETVKEEKRRYYLRHRERILEKQREYRQKHKTEICERVSNYRMNNKEKIIAKRLARKVPLKEACEICGRKENLEKHHPDYNFPLKTQTLCRACHLRIHRSFLAGE